MRASRCMQADAGSADRRAAAQRQLTGYADYNPGPSHCDLEGSGKPLGRKEGPFIRSGNSQPRAWSSINNAASWTLLTYQQHETNTAGITVRCHNINKRCCYPVTLTFYVLQVPLITCRCCACAQLCNNGHVEQAHVIACSVLDLRSSAAVFLLVIPSTVFLFVCAAGALHLRCG